MTVAAPRVITRAEVEDFLYHEAALLDEWKLDEWQELLTDDAAYYVPPNDQLEGDHRTTLFLVADDRERIRQRIIRVLDPNCHAEFPKSRTRRMISNVRIVARRGRSRHRRRQLRLLPLPPLRAHPGICRRLSLHPQVRRRHLPHQGAPRAHRRARARHARLGEFHPVTTNPLSSVMPARERTGRSASSSVRSSIEGSAMAGAQARHDAAMRSPQSVKETPMAKLDDLLEELVTANRILAREGVVDSFGHISVRHPDNPQRYLLSRSRAPDCIEKRRHHGVHARRHAGRCPRPRALSRALHPRRALRGAAGRDVGGAQPQRKRHSVRRDRRARSSRSSTWAHHRPRGAGLGFPRPFRRYRVAGREHGDGPRPRQAHGRRAAPR